MPIGTPPNGSETSAEAAADRALSGSRWLKQLSSLPSMAANVASSSSAGDRSPDRKASTSEQASPSQGESVIRGVMKNIVYHDESLDMTKGVMQYLDQTMRVANGTKAATAR